MVKKFFISCVGFAFSSLYTNAQVGKESNKKQVNDSTAMEQSGKADVYVMDRSIFDPAAIQIGKKDTVAQSAKAKAKKKLQVKKKPKYKKHITFR